MTDRLAEIEGVQDALHDIPDDISVPVSAGLARDLLAVAETARGVVESYDNAEAGSDWTGAMVDTVLRAALANLGGAT